MISIQNLHVDKEDNCYSVIVNVAKKYFIFSIIKSFFNAKNSVWRKLATK